MPTMTIAAKRGGPKTVQLEAELALAVLGVREVQDLIAPLDPEARRRVALLVSDFLNQRFERVAGP